MTNTYDELMAPSKPNPLLYLLSAIGIGALLIVTNNSAYKAGYDAREAEEAARDKWVAEQMADTGFCAWLDQVPFEEECASRRALKEGKP